MAENDWVTVYSAQGKLAADMIRLLLESFGLPVFLSQESVGITYGLTIGDLGEVDIKVQKSRETEAIEILRAMDEGKLEINDNPSPGNEERDANE